MIVDKNTWLVTGLPRSGTTLVCALLNEYPNTLALAEPLILERHGNRERAVQEIKQFIAMIRLQVVTTKRAMSGHISGAVPDNWLEEPSDAVGSLRRSNAEFGVVNVDKSLSADFRLIVKHPGEFSALADLLVGNYPMMAIVRHPLAVLASWQTVDLPVHVGHMPIAEAFNPELAAHLAAEPDRVARQVRLIEWLLSTYRSVLPERVLRYEDLVAAPEASLARIVPNACAPSRALSAYAATTRYAGVDLRKLAKALLRIQPIIEHFYPGFEQSLSELL
jgi:hypothetical protein